MNRFIAVAALTLASLGAATARADSKAFDQAVQPVLAEYLRIHASLAGDSDAGVAEAAGKIAGLTSKLDAKGLTGAHAAHYQTLPGAIRGGAAKVAAAKGLAGQREAFKDLSQAMALWANMSRPAGVYVMFCSMAKGTWLQNDKVLRNPYYGSMMLGCGEITQSPDGEKK